METPMKKLVRHLDPIHAWIERRGKELMPEEVALMRRFFELGGKQGFNAASGKDFKTFDEVYQEFLNEPNDY